MRHDLVASTLEELRRHAPGRYVAGSTFAHFCVDPGLWGVVLWGRPTETDALQLGRSLVLELPPHAAPHLSIVDASRLEGGDEGAFSSMQKYVTGRGSALAAAVTRLALVRPEGLRGAIVAGVFEVLPKPYPVKLFDALGEGLTWLGRSETLESIAALAEQVMGAPPLLGALRSHLDGHLLDATLPSTARALGTSSRSLQRRLADAGLAFQRELADARVRAAQSRLADGDAPLTTIALEIGCASLQHFNTLFRRRTGVSPRVFRDRARAGQRR